MDIDMTHQGSEYSKSNAVEQRNDGIGTPADDQLVANVAVPGSVVDVQPRATQETTFKSRIEQYRKELEADFEAFQKALSKRNSDDELEYLDWDNLQERYDNEMRRQIATENDIMNEFSTRFKQFTLWMQVSNERESERASKRLRTRVTYVQNSEEELAAKQEHHAKVLDAFTNAMSLLGNL